MERNLPWFNHPVIHPPSHHDNQSASYIRYLNNSTSYPASKTMNQPTFQPSSKHLPNQLPRHPVNQLLIQWAIKLSSQPAIQPISYPANRLSSQPAIQPTSHWQRILAAMQYAKRILKYWINFIWKMKDWIRKWEPLNFQEVVVVLVREFTVLRFQSLESYVL